MARPLRIEYPGAWYHITCRGNERGTIFHDDKDRKRFLNALKESTEIFNVEVNCHCMMSNHFHFLLKTREANLSRFMQRFNTAYTTYFNLRHQRSGHLYQGRYKAILVEADEYLLELSRYIHLNPVRLKIHKETSVEEKSKVLKNYVWSSLLGYIGARSREPFMNYKEVLGYMDGDNKEGRRRRYRDFVWEGLREVGEGPLRETKAGAILGSDGFIDWIKEKFLDVEELSNKDYPHIKGINKLVPIEEIAKIVGEEYKVKPMELLKARSKWREARQVVIGMSYRLNFRRRSLQKLGSELGGIGGDAVAHTHARLRSKMNKDRRLSKRVNQIHQRLISQ